MDETINQRIKLLRETLGLNQRDFCNLMSLSGGYIAGIEVNLRPVKDRLIRLIVAEFSANEEWLRTGKGEMFSTTQFNDKNKKTARLVSLFNDLSPKYQDVVLGVIELLRKVKN